MAVYSQADAEALHVQLATKSVCIGPAKASESYLNQTALAHRRPGLPDATASIPAMGFCLKTPTLPTPAPPRG